MLSPLQLTKLIAPLSTLPLPATAPTPITNIRFHPTQPLLFILTSDRTLSILRIRSDAEVEKKKARRKKRDREKKAAAATEDGSAVVQESEEDKPTSWGDKFVLWTSVHASSKIKSFSFPSSESSEGTSSSLKPSLPLLLHLSTNSLETHSVPLPPSASAGKLPKDAPPPEAKRLAGVDVQGHRGDVRCLAVSAGDDLLASGSNGTLKIWNLKTLSCIRTMEGGYAICVCWLPGDRHVRSLSSPSFDRTLTRLRLLRPLQVVVGTKSGSLCLYDISSSTLLSETQAHTGPVWSIQVRPDQRGMVSGSADKDVKFWDFEMKETDVGSQMVKDRMGVERVVSPLAALCFPALPRAESFVAGYSSSQFKSKALALVHTRTLKMTDDVLSVRYSPDGRLLAVALLDATVKVFYQDTLKFFLSLYGHKVSPPHLLLSSLALKDRVASVEVDSSFFRSRSASCPLDGCLVRLEAAHHLLGGQEHQNLGTRLRRLPQVDLRARRVGHAGRV